MSTKSEQDRERLKEEYKDHYRKIKEAKERLKASEKKGKISQALHNMDPDNLLETMDEFLDKVKDKVTHVEARLDVAMDSLGDEEESLDQELEREKHEEALKRAKAKQTLKQVKAEMGMLYSEIEKHADEMHAEKTIGLKKNKESSKAKDTDQS